MQPKTNHCCGRGIFSFQSCQKRYRQRRQEQALLLRRLAHRERLTLVGRHVCLGYTSILLGIALLLSILGILHSKVVSWDRIDNPRSVALVAWGFGMGIGCSVVLLVAESSRHFRMVTHIVAIDEELQEVDTVGTDEDENDEKDDILEAILDDDDTNDNGNDDDYNPTAEERV